MAARDGRAAAEAGGRADAAAALSTTNGTGTPKKLEDIEKEHILHVLEETNWNQTRAAEVLKMSVRSLRHLLDKHKIRHTASLIRESGPLGDSVARLFERRIASRTDYERGAFRRERFGGGSTEPSASGGDERDFAA